MITHTVGRNLRTKHVRVQEESILIKIPTNVNRMFIETYAQAVER